MKSSFLAVDELCGILQKKFGNNSLKMHRTKCSALVKNVLAPYFKKELKDDIKDAPFSIMVDESTDISSTKLLGVSVRYFSERMKKIISTFLVNLFNFYIIQFIVINLKNSYNPKTDQSCYEWS